MEVDVFTKDKELTQERMVIDAEQRNVINVIMEPEDDATEASRCLLFAHTRAFKDLQGEWDVDEELALPEEMEDVVNRRLETGFWRYD